jgi:ubiquinone/menaquinone biosynthesis C-methylase UbiE
MAEAFLLNTKIYPDSRPVMRVQVKPIYEEWAEKYDRDSARNPSIVMEQGIIIPMLTPTRHDSILEVGCGTGRLTVPVAKKCGHVTAIDFSQRMIEVAKRKSSDLSNIEFRRVDIRRGLPFENGRFDKVLAALVINHVDNIEKFFMEVYRVLRKGGSFVFDDIVPDSEFFEVRYPGTLDKAFEKGASVFATHSLQDCVNSLHRAGFEIDTVKFPRFDEKIKRTVTKGTFEANKGHTLGWIFRARKPK